MIEVTLLASTAVLTSTTRRLSRPHLVFSVLLLVTGLRPYPRAALGSALFERISDLTLFFLVGVVLLYFLYHNDWRLELSKSSAGILKLFALLTVIASISLILSPVRILSDTLEVSRLVMYAGLFFTGLVLRWRPRQIVTYIVPPLVFITALQIPLAIGQYFRIDGILYLLQWYTSDRHLPHTRSVGMFFNPYILGMFLVFPFAYFTRRLVSTPDVKTRIVSATFAISILGSIALTQSRSVMIVLIGAIIYMGMLLLVSSRPLFKRYILLAGAVFGVGAIGTLLFFDLGYLFGGFQAIQEGGVQNVGSAETRFERYDYLISLIGERPIFGWGPAKELVSNIENNYLLYLFRYGVLGLFVFLLLFATFTLETFRDYWHCEKRLEDQPTSFYFAIHVWVVALLAGCLTNDFIANPRIYPFLFLLLGVVYSAMRSTEYCDES